MNLLSSLNAGFAAAANGTAEIYVRGSSTRATWYADLEASSSNSSGADITLDAYGSALVYVNQLVDVVVKDASGNPVRSYGDGYSAPNVEVISSAFTGTDYVTAASAVSEPTTLQAVLDLWNTNAGAPDWKVEINGTDTTMLNAFGALSGLVFNVKSPAYGAVGDGVTNDQSAIAAALAAAVAAGGGTVFFPKGTYLISTAIEWAPLVNILGSGPGVSIIKTSSAANARILTFTTGSAHTSPLLIAGVGFDASVSNTGEQIYAAAGVVVMLDMYRVRLGASSTCVGNLLRIASGGNIRATNCRFTAGGSAFCAYLAANSVFSGCTFDTSNSSYNVALCRFDASGVYGHHAVDGCTFNASTVTVAPTALYGAETVSATAYLSCVGSNFVSPTQPFTAGLRFLGGAGTIGLAKANNFLSVTSRYEVTSVLGVGSHLEMQSAVRATGAAAAYTVTSGVSLYELVSTGTAPTITGPTIFFPGQKVDLIVRNSSGANWAALAWGANVAEILGATAVNDTITCRVELIAADVLVADTYSWYAVSFQAG